MIIMSKPVNIAFIVSEEKADEFIHSKSPTSVINKIKSQASDMMKHSTCNGKSLNDNIRRKLND